MLKELINISTRFCTRLKIENPMRFRIDLPLLLRYCPLLLQVYFITNQNDAAFFWVQEVLHLVHPIRDSFEAISLGAIIH